MPRSDARSGRLARVLTFRRRGPVIDIDALYRSHAGMIFRRVLRFFPDDAEAEEVVHEVFMRAMEKQHTFRGDASPSTWLYQLATRHCLNRLRDRRRRRETLALNADLPWLRPSAARDQEATMLLSQLIDQLDEEALLICTLYFVDGMSHAEIARVVGVSRRTIGNRIDDARHRMRAAAGVVG